MERDTLMYALSTEPHYSSEGAYPLTHEKKWVIRKGQPWPGRAITDGTYVYCVVPQDNDIAEVRMSMLPRPESNIHHPELAKDMDVLAAGLMEVHEGVVVCVSNESGHYRPEPVSIGIAIAVFQYWEIPVSEDIKHEGWWALVK